MAIWFYFRVSCYDWNEVTDPGGRAFAVKDKNAVFPFRRFCYDGQSLQAALNCDVRNGTQSISGGWDQRVYPGPPIARKRVLGKEKALV